MINTFSTFVKAISRANLKDVCSEIVKFDDEYNLLVHFGIGLIYERIINYSNFVINLSTTILKKISKSNHMLQKGISTDFNKIQILNTNIYQMISVEFGENENEEDSEDEKVNEEDKYDNNEKSQIQEIILKQHIAEIIKELQSLLDNITMKFQKNDHILEEDSDFIIEELKNNIITKYQLVIKYAKDYKKLKAEIYESVKVTSDQEKIISMMVYASILFDDLTMKLYCLSVDPLIDENSDDLNINIFRILNELKEKILYISYNNPIQIINEIIHISIKFNKVINTINNLFQKSEAELNGILKCNTENYQNLIDVSIAICNCSYAINEIESLASYIKIGNIINSLSSTYLNKKSFAGLISTATSLISSFSEKMKFFEESQSVKQNLLASFNSISKYLEEECIDRDSSSFGLIYTVRILAQYFSDSDIAEKILTDLYQSVSEITKHYAKKCKKHVLLFISTINENLEYFENPELDEANFYFTAFNGINENELNINSDSFISLQQQFFDFLGSSYKSFKQLASSCQEDQLRSNLNSTVDHILALGINFSNWMNHLYSILHTMAHLRSKFVLDILSFPIFLLSPSIYNDNLNDDDDSASSSDDESEDSEGSEEEEEEEDNERKEKIKNVFLIDLLSKKVTKIQKIFEKTPQFLVADIGDTFELIKTVSIISNNFQTFIEFVQKNLDSTFYPLFEYSIISMSQILSRKVPTPLIHVLSLANFDDTNYYLTSLTSSITYSLHILKENREKIEREKTVSPIYISPSYSLFLTATFISEYETNKEKSLHFTSLLSNIYKHFKILWFDSIQLCRNEVGISTFSDTNFNELLSLLNDFLIRIELKYQPSIPFHIPKPIRELKQYRQMMRMIKSSSVIKIGQFLIDTFFQRTIINVHSHNFLNAWFDQVLNLYVEFNEGHHGNFCKVIEKQLTFLEDLFFKKKKCTTKSYTDFIKHLSKASIFIVYEEDESKEDFSNLHKKVILKAKEYFTNSTQLNRIFLEIYDHLCTILYTIKFIKISQTELRNCIIQSYKKVIQIIDYFKNKKHKIKSINVPLLIRELNELDKYETFLSKSNETRTFIEYLIQNNCLENSEKVSVFLSSCILNHFNLVQFQSDSLESAEKEDFQSVANSCSKKLYGSLLQCISVQKKYKLIPRKEMIDKLNSAYLGLNVMLIYLAFYVKSLQRKKEDFLRDFSEIQVSFIKSVSLLNSANSKEETVFKKKKFTKLLKKINSTVNHSIKIIFNDKNEEEEEEDKIDKSEDENSENLVDNVDDDNEEEDEEERDRKMQERESEIERKKLAKIKHFVSVLFSALLEVVFDVSKLNELAAFCFTSDMYETENVASVRKKIVEHLCTVMPEVKSAIEKIELNAALCRTSEMSELSKLYRIVEDALKKFTDRISNIKYSQSSKHYTHIFKQQSKTKKSKSQPIRSHLKSRTKNQEKQKSTIKDAYNTSNTNKDANININNTSNTNANTNTNTNTNTNNARNKDANESIDKYGDGECCSDISCLDDSEFGKLNHLTRLFVPQFQLYSAFLSILSEVSRIMSDPDTAKGRQLLAMQILCNSSFPSPPNLLQSFFLSADSDPYFGFKEDEAANLQILSKYSTTQTAKSTEKVATMAPAGSLYEKHVRRYGLAMKQVENSFNQLHSILSEFNKVAGNKNSTPGELLMATSRLKEATDQYSQKVLQITYFTKKDRALQVEQLIELHKFADSVNDLQKAVKERLTKGSDKINEIIRASSIHDEIFETTADQFREYNRHLFEGKKEVDCNNNEDGDEFGQEMEVLMKLNESHNTVNLMLKDINVIHKDINANKPLMDDLDFYVGPIILSISNILQRAKELTRNRIINAKRDELIRNPVLIDSKGNITRRTSIKDINIKLENEEGLIKAAENLQDAAKKMLVCFTTKGTSTFNILSTNPLEYKIIVSSKSVKIAISDLIAQVLFIGGDPDKIINKEVNELSDLLNGIIKKAEGVCKNKIILNYLKKKRSLPSRNADTNTSIRILPILDLYDFGSEVIEYKKDYERKKKELDDFNLGNK